ncbi:MAG: ATP-binding protein [Clostridiales bacterium]|nr:ATP-binding protein [Clostridiales bacterium]
MRKLLLITGDIAAGKSTFAEILSKRYQVIALCKDDIKEVLGDTIGFSNRQENKKLSEATVGLMAFVFSEFAKLGNDLILEANFHEHELEKLHQIAAENNYEVLTLILQGDVKILHGRYLNRMNYENRHSVHLSTTIDIFEDFKKCIDYSRAENVRGNTITVNADNFNYQNDVDLLGRIDDFMRKAACK